MEKATLGPTNTETRLCGAYYLGEGAAVGLVHSWIAAVVGRRSRHLGEDRADIIQDVHRRLLNNLNRNSFRGECTFKTYVQTVTQYTCIEFARSKHRRRRADVILQELPDPSPGPEQDLLAAERVELAARLIRSLPETHQRLYDLIYRDRLDYQTVGRKLGIATGTVKSRANRFRISLARMAARSRWRQVSDGKDSQ